MLVARIARARGNKSTVSPSDLHALACADVPEAPKMIVGVVKAMLRGEVDKDGFSKLFSNIELHRLTKPNPELLKKFKAAHDIMIDASNFMQAYCFDLPEDVLVATRGKFEGDVVPSLAAIYATPYSFTAANSQNAGQNWYRK